MRFTFLSGGEGDGRHRIFFTRSVRRNKDMKKDIGNRPTWKQRRDTRRRIFDEFEDKAVDIESLKRETSDRAEIENVENFDLDAETISVSIGTPSETKRPLDGSNDAKITRRWTRTKNNIPVQNVAVILPDTPDAVNDERPTDSVEPDKIRGCGEKKRVFPVLAIGRTYDIRDGVVNGIFVYEKLIAGKSILHLFRNTRTKTATTFTPFALSELVNDPKKTFLEYVGGTDRNAGRR